jgi:transposase
LDTQTLLELQAAYIKELENQNKQLERRIIELEDRITKYENQKNSRNSSIPPSKDENRPKKTNSLREETNRKPGGQPGHKGVTLQMTETPDEIKEYIPSFCNCCGRELKDRPYKLVEKRQIADIPEIRIKVIEHRIYERECICGHIATSECNEGIKNRIMFGKNIEALTAYFSVRQYTPFKRLQEMFHDVFLSNISEGGLHELLKRITNKALPVYNQIRGKLEKSRQVGTDETGAKINGDKKWFWTWQNEKLTFITLSDNRGTSTIDKNFKDGFKNAILSHDCWKSHFQTDAYSHQICIAHLLRELKYLSELYKNKWSSEFAQMLRFALDHKKQLIPTDYFYPQSNTILIENWLNELLKKPIDKNQKELVVFRKRMIKYKPFIFTFLHYYDVPPDNNGSERAIRNVKVKLKVSGQFKSDHGADTFAVLRSVIDTAIKNGQNALQALTAIANYNSC